MPSLYASRVEEIFKEVKEIEQRVQDTAGPVSDVSSLIQSAVDRLHKSWDSFVDTLVKEWKRLNIISALLSGAILTTLQFDGVLTDPYTRYFALLALVCSLMSILYGSIYIIRFNTLRRSRKTIGWSKQAQETETSIWWNIRILLALPIIWFSWAFLFYLTCLMTFVWRTGTTSDPALQLTPLTALGPRIVITSTVALGLTYLYLVISEFRQYDKAEIDRWKDIAVGQQLNDHPSRGVRPRGRGGGGNALPQNSVHKLESGRASNHFTGAAAQASYAQPQTDSLYPVPYPGCRYLYSAYGQPIAPNPWFNGAIAAENHAIHREQPSDVGPERRWGRRGGVGWGPELYNNYSGR